MHGALAIDPAATWRVARDVYREEVTRPTIDGAFAVGNERNWRTGSTASQAIPPMQQPQRNAAANVPTFREFTLEHYQMAGVTVAAALRCNGGWQPLRHELAIRDGSRGPAAT